MKKIIFASILALAVTACKKQGAKGDQGPQGPAGTGTTGTITGKVTQYNQYGIKDSVALNTVTISVEGKNFTAITDENGKYSLENIPPGIYNLSFKKPGYGVWQQQQVNFPGNGTLYQDGYVAQKPTYTFAGCKVRDSIIGGEHRIYVTTNLAPALAYATSVVVISGKSAALDLADPLSYDGLTSKTVPANTGSNTYLLELGTTGTKYYKVYPYANVTVTGRNYYDYSKDKAVYTAYGSPWGADFSITIP